MQKYKYIFFDLDGTLTDSAEGITNCVAYALEKFGIQESDKDALRRFVGPPLVPAFMEFYGFNEENAKKAVEHYRERFASIGIFENSVYDGVRELLESLKEKGYTLVIATSKPETYAKRIAEHFDIAKYFTYIAGATFDGKIGTKTEVIEYAIKALNISNRCDAVMIGDRYHDVEGAHNTGLDCIGVLYGYGSRDELAEHGAKLIAQTPMDIEKLL